jgi:hypothetical protein
MCRRRIEGNKIFLLSWVSPEEEFLVRPLRMDKKLVLRRSPTPKSAVT